MHDDGGTIRRPYAGKRWIACRLEFRGWRRSPLMQPGRYTELFFLDDATALAAGHRPCALCRREDFVRFRDAWRELHPADRGADAIDARLHRERFASRSTSEPLPIRPIDELPDGAFVLIEDVPYVVHLRRLMRWTPDGYVAGEADPAVSRAPVITPPTVVEILRRGWTPVVPFIHDSAALATRRGPRPNDGSP